MTNDELGVGPMTTAAPVTGVAFEVSLPPRGLSPNGSHGHWTTKLTARRAYCAEVMTTALAAVPPGHPMREATTYRRVSLVFGTKHGRACGAYQPRDVDNALAAFKAGFDGLIAAGLLVDDAANWMTLGSVELDRRAGPWVRISIEEVDR